MTTNFKPANTAKRLAQCPLVLLLVKLMNSFPSIPEITTSSFDGHVLRSELPVLVLFSAVGDVAGNHLLHWLGEWTPRASSFLTIVQVAHTEARLLAARWGVPSVPSLALFHAGSVCYQFCGHCSRRELDDVLTRAAILSLSRDLASPPDKYGETPPVHADE